MPPWGVPVVESRMVPSSPRTPACRNAFTTAKTRLVPDPRSHPVHQGRMVDHVEARLDVTFHHPLIRAGGELVNLSNRVLGAPPRTEAIRAWLEVRLEDRLEHQFEGRLHGAVPRGRDAKPSQLGAARLGDHPFSHREWSEQPCLQIVPKLRQELFLRGEDRLRPKPVDPRRPFPPVAPDPSPATTRTAGSHTRLNRSSNRRSGSSIVH